ncbi:MAG TPA: alpha/beta fold hydrolase [Actinomycetota bacterium]|nr:alpha/beta fold hydrolase [Actinomycetota bacterium]
MADVLLVHAWPLDGSMWDDQVRALGDQHRVLAPSFPGFGGTEGRDELTMASMADFLVDQLDREGVQKAIVCGLSIGGYVTFEMWRRHPQRIAGLVLADTRAEADDEAGRQRRDGVAAKVRADGAQALVDAPPALLTEGSEHWDRVKGIIGRQDAEAIAQAALAMRDRPDSTGTLSSIDVPTTVVVGSEDALTPPAMSETIASGVPNSELVVLDGAGHLSNLEAPEGFLAALRNLIERVG